MITRASFSDIAYVVQNMREADKKEFLAVSHCATTEELILDVIERYRRLDLWCCCDAFDTPVCIGGPIFYRPRVATMVFVSTDEFNAALKPVIRFIRNELWPLLQDEAKVHRIETIALSSPRRSWLELLGLKKEGTLVSYGKNQEDFDQYAWVCRTDN